VAVHALSTIAFRAEFSADARLVRASNVSNRGSSVGNDSFARSEVKGCIGAVIDVRDENINDGFTEMRTFANACAKVISVIGSTCFPSNARINLIAPC